jgi:hypothetical protein
LGCVWVLHSEWRRTLWYDQQVHQGAQPDHKLHCFR